jgi:hypothetical protein
MSDFNQIAAALVAFQGEVPVIPKNRTAKMGSYSYKYADLSDIWDAVRAPLSKNGLAVTQQLCGPHGTPDIGITTTIWHESGQRDASTIYLSTAGKNPQEVGSLLTYFKRYALAAALGISTDDDDDGSAATHSASRTAPRQQARPAAPPVTRSDADLKRDELRTLATLKGWDLATVAAKFAETVKEGSSDLKKASADEVSAFIVSLESGVVKL